MVISEMCIFSHLYDTCLTLKVEKYPCGYVETELEGAFELKVKDF